MTKYFDLDLWIAVYEKEDEYYPSSQNCAEIPSQFNWYSDSDEQF